MLNRIVTWNTGRGYGTEGQIISARYDGERLWFYDHTRRVCGSLLPVMSVQEEYDVRQEVMCAYDAPGGYEQCSLSEVEDLRAARTDRLRREHRATDLN
jgi:hypothetical protein